MYYKLHTLFNPEIFQGKEKKKSYFEGWYFKIVDSTENHAFAIIPGIAFDPAGNGHAFIQLLDGKNKKSFYNTYESSEFSANDKNFNIKIGNNSFSEYHVTVRLDNFKADLIFDKNIPWPKPFYSPGIMGPFSFIPFMECYHGIVSLNHNITGRISYNGQDIDFTKGKGYMEKDWGSSFPSAYVWMQSNHFERENISFKCSVAKIPFLSTSFVGFIAGLWLDGELIRFTTYNRCSLSKCSISQKQVNIVLQHKDYTLEVEVDRNEATELASPIIGFMSGRIEETMTSVISLKLIKKNGSGEVIYLHGRNSCLEVAGAIDEIIK